MLDTVPAHQDKSQGQPNCRPQDCQVTVACRPMCCRESTSQHPQQRHDVGNKGAAQNYLRGNTDEYPVIDVVVPNCRIARQDPDTTALALSETMQQPVATTVL